MPISFHPMCRSPALKIMIVLSLGLVLASPLAAQEPFHPKLTPEFLDSQKGADGTWFDDPAVPDLPPLPVTDDPGLNPDSFFTTRYTNTIYPPRIANPPPPLNGLVNNESPLKIDVFWSMRSPYSYLSDNRGKSKNSPGG